MPNPDVLNSPEFRNLSPEAQRLVLSRIGSVPVPADTTPPKLSGLLPGARPGSAAVGSEGLEEAGAPAAGFVTGAAASVPSTLMGLLEMAGFAPQAVQDANQSIRSESGPGFQAGLSAGNAAQFFAPFPGGQKLAAAGLGVRALANAVRDAAMSGAQGGSPVAAGAVSGGATLAAGALPAAGRALASSAEGQMGRLFNPTTKPLKALAEEKVIPGALERRLRAPTARGLSEKVSAGVDDAAKALESEIQSIPAAQRVDARAVIKRLDDMASETTGTGGTQFDEGRARAIEGLREKILAEPPTFASMRRLRQILDKQVSSGGKVHGRTLAEGSKLDIQREAADAIRHELAKATPNLDRLNKEFSFWKNAELVLGETATRRVGQERTVRNMVGNSAATGGLLGGLAVDSPELALSGALLAGLTRAVRSTAWRTYSAAGKTELAEAIAAGKFDKAAKILQRLSGATAAQATRE